MRMSKGWILVGTTMPGFGNTETKRERIKRMQKFDIAIHNLSKRSEEEMKEDAEKTFLSKRANDAQLLQAFNEKKLKSKTAIKKAKVLRKRANKGEAAVAATV